MAELEVRRIEHAPCHRRAALLQPLRPYDVRHRRRLDPHLGRDTGEQVGGRGPQAGLPRTVLWTAPALHPALRLLNPVLEIRRLVIVLVPLTAQPFPPVGT